MHGSVFEGCLVQESQTKLWLIVLFLHMLLQKQLTVDLAKFIKAKYVMVIYDVVKKDVFFSCLRGIIGVLDIIFKAVST